MAQLYVNVKTLNLQSKPTPHSLVGLKENR